MKNKDKYNLNDLKITKRKVSKDFTLAYYFEIEVNKEVYFVQGGALSDLLAWLEREV